MHRLLIPAVFDNNGCVALIVTKNPDRSREFTASKPKLDASPPPILLPVCLPMGHINAYVAGKLELENVKSENFQSKEFVYRVPPLVNNLTQKTHKNVFTLERFAQWKKQNGGITKFYGKNSKAKS
jgi:hypothetical protein